MTVLFYFFCSSVFINIDQCDIRKTLTLLYDVNLCIKAILILITFLDNVVWKDCYDCPIHLLIVLFCTI